MSGHWKQGRGDRGGVRRRRDENKTVGDNACIPPKFDDSIVLVYPIKKWKATPVNLPSSEIIIRNHLLLGEHYAMAGRSDSVLPEN